MKKAYILSGIGNALSIGELEVCLEFRTREADEESNTLASGMNRVDSCEYERSRYNRCGKAKGQHSVGDEVGSDEVAPIEMAAAGIEGRHVGQTIEVSQGNMEGKVPGVRPVLYS